jgi:TonB family protein
MRFGFCFPILMLIGTAMAHAQDAKPCTPDPQSEDKVRLTAVEGTHTLPHFTQNIWALMISKKNFDVTVMMDVHISRDGTADEVEVSQSSGYRNIDSLAVSQIKRFWRWEPPIDLTTCTVTDTHKSIPMRFWTKD